MMQCLCFYLNFYLTGIFNLLQTECEFLHASVEKSLGRCLGIKQEFPAIGRAGQLAAE
jgi:hypothetical protein